MRVPVNFATIRHQSDGARATVADHTIVYGEYPTGRPRGAHDNVGVQAGLLAITPGRPRSTVPAGERVGRRRRSRFQADSYGAMPIVEPCAYIWAAFSIPAMVWRISPDPAARRDDPTVGGGIHLGSIRTLRQRLINQNGHADNQVIVDRSN
jgi:hypothetical protein